MKIKFATPVANGQSVQPQGVTARPTLPGPNENAASASQAASNSTYRCWIVSGNKAETSSGHGAGLAGHGLGEALTLQSGRQVHFAPGEKAGKELHHHLHLVAQTGRLRLMEWGSSFLLALI
ncbi:hypothetical protein [Mesorhizobium sp.]|uniref:hypothetical protein n=1 Tax=Mesorhizobium sp. TaxID=1871066 RepID=UPI0025B7DF1F|nr:hypothetical protein [Mesorhizobium sp.]